MIWLIGNKGMLGQEIEFLLQTQCQLYIGTDKEIDITDKNELIKFTKKKNKEQSIDWIINCAAYTAVDKAEDDRETAKLLNTEGAANIASCAAKINARLIHISTDYVFDGMGISVNGRLRPYTEDDETNPIGVYGLTKRNGEIAVMQNNPSSYIIRTSWLYGKYGKNFVSTMLKLMNERDEVKVVNDQKGSPTYAYDLAVIVLTIIEDVKCGKNVPYGIYDFSNEGEITWFDFAKEIYKNGKEQGIINSHCEVKSCISEEFPEKVKRPKYSVLDKNKIKTVLGIEIPDWRKSLKNYFKEVL